MAQSGLNSAHAPAGSRRPQFVPETAAATATGNQPHRPRRGDRLPRRQHAADDVVLDLHLQPLRGAGRKHAAALESRERSSTVIVPFRNGPESMLAVATASWTARSTPTPPIGDIACAASPMQSRPGRYHCCRRSTLMVSSLMSSQLASSWTWSWSCGATSTTDARKASSPLALMSSMPPLAITNAHCQ